MFDAEYRQLAKDREATGENATCLAITMQLGYTVEMIENTPKDGQMGIMCGCPPAHLELKPGMRCLDLGSGAGTDVILCALKVQGNGGKAFGLDILPEMTARAASNAGRTKGLAPGTAEFKVCNINAGEIATTFEQDYFDVVTSNCCVCLFEQPVVFPTIFACLKPGGVFCFAESMQKAPLPPEMRAVLREAYEKKIYPCGRDAACKGFRASVAIAHDQVMSVETISADLARHGFVCVEACATLVNPQGLSPKPLPVPELTADSLSKSELDDFRVRFARAWAKYPIDDHVVYACMKARKPSSSS